MTADTSCLPSGLSELFQGTKAEVRDARRRMLAFMLFSGPCPYCAGELAPALLIYIYLVASYVMLSTTQSLVRRQTLGVRHRSNVLKHESDTN